MEEMRATTEVEMAQEEKLRRKRAQIQAQSQEEEEEEPEEEEERASQLHKARQHHYLNVRKEVTELAERVGEKLQKMIEEGNVAGAFTIALILACIKDGLDIVLDLMGVGEIPIVGGLPGLFLSVVIYIITGPSFKNKIKLRVAWWMLGFVVDGLPLFNALPINTLLVLYTWHQVRKEAANAERQLERLGSATIEELQEIDSTYAEAA